MSTLDIFVSRNSRTLSDDDVYGDRLTTRHVCGALRRYFEAHLALLVEEKRVRSDERLIRCTSDPVSALHGRSSQVRSINLSHFK